MEAKTEKDLLVGVLTKTLNKTDEEIAELLYQQSEDSEEVSLKEDAFDLVLDADANRVSKLKKSAKPDDKALKDQYLKGVKDGKAELEKEIREITGLETDAIGPDLVKEAVNHLSDCNVPTEDQIKAHPLYVALEKDRIPKDEYDTLKTEFDDYKSNQDRSLRLSKVKSDVVSIFTGLNPVISENPTVAKTREQDFLRKFENYEYELAEDGNHLVIQNGTRLEDKHGNPIKFAEFVKSVAELNYDFKVGQQAGQAGNRNTGNGAGSQVDVPKTEVEYLAKMNALIIAGDKEGSVKLKAAWDESQNK